MSNLPQIYENENFGKIRVIMKGDEPWFVGKDVCECLDLRNHRTSLALLNSDEKDAVHTVDAIGRNQQTTFISEAGMYSLAVSLKRKPLSAGLHTMLFHLSEKLEAILSSRMARLPLYSKKLEFNLSFLQTK